MKDEEILKKFKMNVAINNFRKEKTKEHTLKNKMNRRGYIMKRKLIAVLCGCFIFVSGVVLAGNYNKIISTFGLGKGVDSAVNNGYIGNPNMNYIESNTTVTEEINSITVDNINIKTKIEDFLMDDINISTHFIFEIDTKINEIIDFDDLKSIELKDLIVTDEENRILYCMNKETFDKYCKDNNLDYKYIEFNENYYNCGVNTFVQYHYKENGTVKFTYNMYTGDVSFPKSKQLNFNFSNIVLKRNDWLENEHSVVNLKGNWNIKLDVPEKMYNRESISYKVVNSENPDFQIINATLYDTSFEFGMIISNVEKPEMPEILKELYEKYETGKIDITQFYSIINGNQEYRNAMNNYYSSPVKDVTYVENENGQKFESTDSPSRRQYGNYIDGDKYSFYETFGLTKNEATEKLKVCVYFKDKLYIVELEKAQ